MRQLIDRLVYLNFPGDHLPVSPNNIFFWMMIGLMVALLIVVLYIGVYTAELAPRDPRDAGQLTPPDAPPPYYIPHTTFAAAPAAPLHTPGTSS